jgi:ATP-dependent Clp protease ATP-binding subunit ClpC
LLHKLGVNLTQMAAAGTLEVTMPREEITESILDVLAKRKGNSACLLGDAGVGKTSMVRALASHIASDGELPEIDERIVVELSMPKLMAGTSMRGSLAERVAEIRAEVKKSGGRIVIFFDDVHELFCSDAQEAAAELKSAMEHGEISCIGATSAEAFRRMVEADGSLSRLFSTILVEEMSPEEAFLALKETAPILGEHHKAELSDEVIAAAVGMTKRYMPEARLPDKALRVLDLACARTRRRSESAVTLDRLAQAVSELCDVPVERLLGSDGERMLALETTLAERVVGHTSALTRIARVLRRSASGFRWKRPIGTFLMLGPTGVGKTETAKAIAECLFDSEHAMTRLDMSEFAEAHTISRLLGAPPGYVGHEAGGQLTEAVRKRPYQVVLLDEIEKANRDVLEAFLQVFDEGRLTDGRGRTVDFTNTVILMTSNLGVAEATHAGKRSRIGFSGGDSGTQHKAFEEALLGAARKDLPPELYNRIDEVIAMSSLSRSDVAEVARRMLKQLGSELEKSRGVRLDVGEEAIVALLDQGGYDPEMGARPMRRTIGRLVEAPIAEMLLRGELDRGDVALLYVDDGKLGVDIVTRDAGGARGAAE